jgi:hypothetical protein
MRRSLRVALLAEGGHVHVEGDAIPQLRQSGRLNQPRDFAPPPHDGFAFGTEALAFAGLSAGSVKTLNPTPVQLDG